MSVAGLAIDATNRAPIVLLRDPSGRRQVPIWVDHAQAHNIMIGIQNPSSKRPLSHDLMMELLKAGNLYLDRVIIHSIEESTFQAVLKLQVSRSDEAKENNDSPSLIEIEARPSDAIALAVRTSASIWMLEEVVAEASIPVDADADAKDQDQFRQFVENLSPSELVNHLKNEKPGNESFDSPEPEDKANQ